MSSKGYSFKALLDEYLVTQSEMLRVDAQAKAIGNIMNPLFHMPLLSNLALNAGNGEVDFTRATTGSYIDRWGVVQTALVDEPRFEKDGLLIEGQSTNEIFPSEDFTSWTAAGGGTVTPTASQVLPDGTTGTVDLLSTSIEGDENYYASVTGNITAGNIYTASVFFKRAGGNCPFRVVLHNNVFGVNYSVKYDPATGEFTTENSPLDFSFVELANGWYRVSVTAEATTTATPTAYKMLVWPSGLGESVGDGWYIWGAQVEEAPQVSSYIKTTTAAVTRSPDILLVENVNIPATTDAQTIIADVNFGAIGTGEFKGVYKVLGETYRLMWLNTGNNLQGYHGTIADTYTISTETKQRVGLVFDGTLSELFTDGVGTGSPATATAVTGTTGSIVFGATDIAGSYPLNGHLKNIRIYDFALTDEEMRLA